MGKGFAAVGKGFAVVGKGFAVLGEGFAAVGKGFAVMEKKHTAFGNVFEMEVKYFSISNIIYYIYFVRKIFIIESFKYAENIFMERL